MKRPDISLFCREPDEQDEAIRLVPEAVIEVVSAGYEAKDLEIGPRFYLTQGVKDIIVFDPHTLLALLPAEPHVLYNFHCNMLRHGQRVCIWGTPRCEQCPLTDRCNWFQAHRSAAPTAPTVR